MQDAEPVAIGDRGDEQVDGREATVSHPSQPALRIERTPLGLECMG